MEDIKKIIPPNVPMNASTHIAPQFLLHNPVYPEFSHSLPYILLDLDDPYDHPPTVEKIRRMALASSQYQVLYNRAFYGRHLLLFGPAVNGQTTFSKSPSITTVSTEQWEKSGTEFPSSNSDFALRVIPLTRTGQRVILLLVKLLKKVDYDVKITVTLTNGSEQRHFANRFGDGVEPADQTLPGQVFMMPLPVPSDWRQARIAGIELRKIAFQ